VAAEGAALLNGGPYQPDRPKYLAISGGHPCLFGADTLVPGESAILTEGEFDAMLLWQKVGDLVGVTTLGSCNRGLSARALRYLLGCPRQLVAYDVDAEGVKGAERLAQLSSRMRRIRPLVGKDVTAFWQAGGRVREWVRFELGRVQQLRVCFDNSADVRHSCAASEAVRHGAPHALTGGEPSPEVYWCYRRGEFTGKEGWTDPGLLILSGHSEPG
jgi:hypothetical protein